MQFLPSEDWRKKKKKPWIWLHRKDPLKLKCSLSVRWFFFLQRVCGVFNETKQILSTEYRAAPSRFDFIHFPRTLTAHTEPVSVDILIRNAWTWFEQEQNGLLCLWGCHANCRSHSEDSISHSTCKCGRHPLLSITVCVFAVRRPVRLWLNVFVIKHYWLLPPPTSRHRQ